MKLPQFRCNFIGIAFLIIGGIFILINMSFKAWMILIGILFILIGIKLVR